VAEQETPRALLTVGEILQLSADEALILVSGVPPIRARKLRYYLDGNFLRRRMLPPALGSDAYADAPPPHPHDWCSPALTPDPRLQEMSASTAVESHPHDDAQTPRPRERERNKARVSDLPLLADLADSAIADDNPQSADRADDERVTKFPGLRL
jgi:type IV secretion system protein VirD4